jgi:hypothetical protein
MENLAFSDDQSVGRCVLGSTSLEHKKTGMVKKRSVSSLLLFDKLQATTLLQGNRSKRIYTKILTVPKKVTHI